MEEEIKDIQQVNMDQEVTNQIDTTNLEPNGQEQIQSQATQQSSNTIWQPKFIWK